MSPAPTPPGNTTPPRLVPPEQVRPKYELEGSITAVERDARMLTVPGQVVRVPDGVPIHHGQTPIPFTALRVNDRVYRC